MPADERVILPEFEFALDGLLVLARIISVALTSPILVPYRD